MSWMPRSCVLLAIALMSLSCGGATGPVEVDTHNDRCAQCRMPVSNVRFAAQMVAPGEDPALFDDIGCLASYLQSHTRLSRDAVAYVADHRTGEWTPAANAVFTRNPALDTPMNSHVIAHASIQSRDADPAAGGGTDVSSRDLFPLGVPAGGAG